KIQAELLHIQKSFTNKKYKLFAIYLHLINKNHQMKYYFFILKFYLRYLKKNKMKKRILLPVAYALILSCNQASKTSETPMASETPPVTDEVTRDSNTPTAFNIEEIPFTAANFDDFPFFTLPEGLKAIHKPFERKFDVCFFPINGIMSPQE